MQTLFDIFDIKSQWHVRSSCKAITWIMMSYVKLSIHFRAKANRHVHSCIAPYAVG